MSAVLRRGALAALAATLVSACGDTGSRPGFEASPRIRATAVLEPPRVGIGEVATLEVAVVTPPQHHVTPYRPPGEVSGFWLLGIESLPVREQGARWVHRTRIRLRARKVGRFSWPGAEITVEAPDGSAHTVALAERPLEVLSILPEFPDRLVPFGLRALADEPETRSALAPFAAGAVTALACIALIWATRRRLGRASADATESPAGLPTDPPWSAASRKLAEALALGPEDPRRAAGIGAVALREFMQRRFGGDVTPCTTEELAQARPPFAATSRWLPFLAILRRFDELHFRPAGADPAGAERLRGTLEEARDFVERATPPEASK